MNRPTLKQTMQTRITTYKIDDEQYFRNLLIRQGADKATIEAVLDCANAFKASYTLVGTPGQYPDRYELFDENGNKMCITDLNGYQKGIVINACIKHYLGELAAEDITGVVSITENLIDNVA